MIHDLISKLGIKLEMVDEDHIQTESGGKARGAFRWNYIENRAEILLARSATERTWRHEIGHAINFILGNGKRYSDEVGIESEAFANLVADILELCYSGTKEVRPKGAGDNP